MLWVVWIQIVNPFDNFWFYSRTQFSLISSLPIITWNTTPISVSKKSWRPKNRTWVLSPWSQWLSIRFREGCANCPTFTNSSTPTILTINWVIKNGKTPSDIRCHSMTASSECAIRICPWNPKELAPVETTGPYTMKRKQCFRMVDCWDDIKSSWTTTNGDCRPCQIDLKSNCWTAIQLGRL